MKKTAVNFLILQHCAVGNCFIHCPMFVHFPEWISHGGSYMVASSLIQRVSGNKRKFPSLAFPSIAPELIWPRAGLIPQSGYGPSPNHLITVRKPHAWRAIQEVCCVFGGVPLIPPFWRPLRTIPLSSFGGNDRAILIWAFCIVFWIILKVRLRFLLPVRCDWLGLECIGDHFGIVRCGQSGYSL